MSKVAGALLCLVFFASVIYTGSASAEDDDTQASVYLVFDPETGEFATVDDPSVAAQHKAQQDQEAIDSVVETADGASASTATNADESPMTWIIGTALIATMLGGALWVQRIRQRAD